MNFEFEREIGFINSQPSLAECLTSFPAVLESFQTSSIKESTVIPPPFEHTIPSLSPSPCTGSQPRPPPPPRHHQQQQHNNSTHRRTNGTASNGLIIHHSQSIQHPAGQAPNPATATTTTAVTPPAEFPWMKEKKSSKKCPKPHGSNHNGGGNGSGGMGGEGGGASGAGAIIPPASCSPSPTTASGYSAAGIDSPTGR